MRHPERQRKLQLISPSHLEKSEWHLNKGCLYQGIVTISHYFKDKEEADSKMEFIDAATETTTPEQDDIDIVHVMSDPAVHTVEKALYRDEVGSRPGASAESPPRSSLEKMRRVDEEKSTTEKLLAALIHKIDEMNSNLTSRLDTVFGKIESNENEIYNFKDEQESCRFDMKQLQEELKKQGKDNMKLKERLGNLTYCGVLRVSRRSREWEV